MQDIINSINLSVEDLITSGRMFSGCSTGAGLSIPHYLNRPGLSKVLREWRVPYSEEVLQSISKSPLGVKALSYYRAHELRSSLLNPTANPSLLTIGVTGALATNRERKGPEVIYFTAGGFAASTSARVFFEKGKWFREEEELFTCFLALSSLLVVQGMKPYPFDRHTLPPFFSNEIAPVDNTRFSIFCPRIIDFSLQKPLVNNPLVIPITANPVHIGHLAMYKWGEQSNFSPLFQIEHHHPEKSTSMSPEEQAYIETDMLLSLQGYNAVITDKTGLYVEKFRVNPNTTWLLGNDAYAKLWDLQWGVSQAETIKTILSTNTKIVVSMRNFGPEPYIPQEIEDRVIVITLPHNDIQSRNLRQQFSIRSYYEKR